MKQTIDATRWTGLSPHLGHGDVRLAQAPVPGGPKPLEPVHYRERAINWTNAFFAIPIWAAVSIAGDGSALDAACLALTFAGLFVALSLALHFWRSRPGRTPTITLSEDGLVMPYQFKEPIPWSKIGQIERSYGRWMRWTSIFIDKNFEAVQLAPWPLSLLPEQKRKPSMPMVIISSWNMAVDMDDLIPELTHFRDNYCAE